VYGRLYIYHTTKTAKMKKVILHCTTLTFCDVLQSNITFFDFCSFSCVIYVQSTLHVVVNLSFFVFYTSVREMVNLNTIQNYWA